MQAKIIKHWVESFISFILINFRLIQLTRFKKESSRMAKNQIVLLVSLLVLFASSAVVNTQGSSSGKASSTNKPKQTNVPVSNNSTTTKAPLKVDPNSPYANLSVEELNKLISDMLSKSKVTPPVPNPATPAPAPPVQPAPKVEQPPPVQEPQPDQTTHQSVDIPPAETTTTDPSITESSISNTIVSDSQSTGQANHTIATDNQTSVTNQTGNADASSLIDTSKSSPSGDNTLVPSESTPTAVKISDDGTYVLPKPSVLMTSNTTMVEGYVPPTNVGLCKDDEECHLNYHDYVVAGLNITCNPKIGVCEAL